MTGTKQREINHSTPDQFLAADPSASAWVSASAGTGKTHVLANRVMRLMLAGTSPQRILCLTYTRAAAAQMSNRINETLGRWTLAPDVELAAELEALLEAQAETKILSEARRLFAQVLDVPGGLKIQTIHAFCQSLLGRFPIEAQLPPHFDLMDQRSAAELMFEASQSVLTQAQSAGMTPLARALVFVSDQVMAPKFQELTENLSKLRGRLFRLNAAYHSVDGASASLRHLLELAEDEDDESILATACEEQAFDSAGLRAAVEALLQGGKTDIERGQKIAHWLAGQDARAAEFSLYLSAFLTQKGTVRETLASKGVIKRTPEIVATLEVEADRLIDVDQRRRRALVARATESLLIISGAQLSAYEDAKSRRAVLDYEDLILKTRELLHLPGVAPWVLYKLDGGIDHVLIDEAQDTSPDQWQVVAALANEFFVGLSAQIENRSVFAVGDVKQSIYGFQGADPAEFNAMHGHFANRARQANRPFRKVPLETSFRSTSSVLRLVDEVFAPGDARDGLTFQDETIRHQAFREGAAGLVELWPTIVPDVMDDVEPWSPPVEQIRGSTPEEKTADLIAETISRWLREGEILEARGRAVTPGDILILVRRRTEFVSHLVRALKQLRVPVAGADRMVLTEQLAVMDLISLGNFVLLPEDDLTLAQVLKGPLIGMDEEQLFSIAYDRGKQTLWHSLCARAQEGGIFAEAVDFLIDQLARVDFVPPYEFYAGVLGRCGGRRRMVGRLGPEANDPIDEFINLALEYERGHPPSLQGFLHWIEAAETKVSRDAEHFRDEVRVMTVHGAKGLETPIVFLPDTTGKPSQDDSFLWLNDENLLPNKESPGLFVWPVKRENETGVCDMARMDSRALREREYRRLLYVALTRAEDRLYVCGWETRNGRAQGCWYDLVADAFNRLTVIEEVDQGDDGILRRLANPQITPVKPPVAATEIAPAPPVPAWSRIAPLPEPVPPQPLVPSRPDVEPPPVLSPVEHFQESGGLLRGRLVHRLLQLLPDIVPGQREASARRFFAQAAPDWSAQQIHALIKEVFLILDHPDFAPLFGPNSQAEVPIAGTVGQFAISGQIDRLVITDHEILIVDYKSNRNPPLDKTQVPVAYLGQMSTYRTALAEVFPDHQIRCALLWTEGPRLMPLTDL